MCRSIHHLIIRILPLVVVFALGTAPAVVRADDDSRGASVGIVVIPEGLKEKDVRAAVVAAFNNRGWALREADGDVVVGYLRKRGNEAKVTVVIRDEQAEFFCEGYTINRNTGERLRPEIPESWIKYLKADTTKWLNQRLGMR